MKFLPTILFLLLALRGYSQSAYIYQLPITNRVASTTRVIVLNTNLGTNDTWTIPVNQLLSSSAYPTNWVTWTNDCYVITNGNTSLVLVSGAGTAAANGNYTNVSGSGLTAVFAGASAHGIYFDGTFDWHITNSSAASLYTLQDSTSTPIGTWTVDTGAGPAPTSAFANSTNCFAVPFKGGNPDPGTKTYVDTNTTLGVVYANAGANLSNVFATLPPGTQVLNIGPGIYRFNGNRPTTFNGLSNAPCRITLATNLTINMWGAILWATNDGGILCYIGCSNLTFNGGTFRGTQTNGTAYDVSGGLANYGLVSAWGTNTTVTFNQTHFEDVNSFALFSGGYSSGVEALTRNLRLVQCTAFKCGFTNWNGASVNPDGGFANLHPDGYLDNLVIDTCGRGVEWFGFAGGQSGGFITIRNTLFRHIWGRNIFIISGVDYEGVLIDNCQFLINRAARQNASELINLQNCRKVRISNSLFTNGPVTASCIQARPTFGNVSELEIADNLFSHCTYGVEAAYINRGTLSGNTFKYVTNLPVRISGSDIALYNNLYLNSPIGSGAGPCVWVSQDGASTNVTIHRERYVRDSGTAPDGFITIESAARQTRVSDCVYVDRTATPMLSFISDSGVDSSIQFQDRVTFATLTAGCYTNLQDDTHVVIPLSGIRTNKLANPFRGHSVTVDNGAQNATAVVVRATSGVIYNGTAFGGTNEMALGTNQGASATFLGDGTNWTKIAESP